jgi:pimeloyl-ACP methyl ester carboxylesterase
MKVMERAAVDGLELEYELRGSGEPVVLIHWGVSATWAEPLLEERALADHFRLLSYHRAGFGGSSPLEGPVTMADHAKHCRLLMRRLGIERAHILGHSSSVAVALQLALDAPEAVHTVASMDAARPAPPTELQAAFRREFVEPAVELYRAVDTEAAVDTFFRGVFGPGYREPLEQGLPGAFDQAVSDADTFFTQELPALWQRWSFTEEDARCITQPVLAVVGEHSAPTFPERRELLLSWLPDVEPFELPGATHLLHVQNPKRDGRSTRLVLRAAPAHTARLKRDQDTPEDGKSTPRHIRRSLSRPFASSKPKSRSVVEIGTTSTFCALRCRGRLTRAESSCKPEEADAQTRTGDLCSSGFLGCRGSAHARGISAPPRTGAPAHRGRLLPCKSTY